ncbi:hypothetical protein AA0111_g8338 [Alternaria arborescens]|nr:hypothetical protein AA0111_g8338 [Alternaria arborescens]RYO26336.1 hypothetical protein AA0111_g8338 [Alternaria arborescens]
MHDLLPLANEWALLDALGLLIEDEIYLRTMSVSLDPGNPWCNESSISTNGTTFFDCGDWVSGHLVVMNTSSPLAGSVFDTSRDQTVIAHLRDPREYLNITQDLLNDVLTIIAISAISLGAWWDMVPITTTRYEST